MATPSLPSHTNMIPLNLNMRTSTKYVHYYVIAYVIPLLMHMQETPEARLEKAFEVAEKTINIPKLLNVNEVMKGTTDERALVLYASLFFHAFSAKAQREAMEEQQREAASKLGSLESSLHSAQHSREELLRQLSLLEKSKYVTVCFSCPQQARVLMSL